MDTPNRVSAALFVLAKKNDNGPIDSHKVKELVENGADVTCVMEMIEEGNRTVTTTALHLLIARGALDCFIACMESKLPIDFTCVSSSSGRTPLHEICHLSCFAHFSSPHALAGAMLRAVMHRFRQFRFSVVGDKIDWEQCDEKRGLSFLSYIAYCHQLHMFWPIVESLDFFKSQSHPLWTPVFEFDWEQLEEAGKSSLQLRKGFLSPSEALFRLSEESQPDIDGVWSCVDAGATMLVFGDEDEGESGTRPSSERRRRRVMKPTLNGFIRSGSVAALIACLTTSHSIDFSVREIDHDGGKGDTVLHAVCRTESDHDGYMLLGIVDRLENNPEKDIVDWGQLNEKEGLDFISFAAMKGKLWLFWPMIKDSVSYFNRPTKPIRITTEVFGWDWRRLPPEDQCRLELLKGLKGY